MTEGIILIGNLELAWRQQIETRTLYINNAFVK